MPRSIFSHTFLFAKDFLGLMFGDHSTRSFYFLKPVYKPYRELTKKELIYSYCRYVLGLFPAHAFIYLIVLSVWSPFWQDTISRKVLISSFVFFPHIAIVYYSDLRHIIKNHKSKISKDSKDIFVSYAQLTYRLCLSLPLANTEKYLNDLLSKDEFNFFKKIDRYYYILEVPPGIDRGLKGDHIKFFISADSKPNSTSIKIKPDIKEFQGKFFYLSPFDKGRVNTQIIDLLENFFKESKISNYINKYISQDMDLYKELDNDFK